MKNIITISLLLALLTSCGGKTSNIVSFSTPLIQEDSGETIKIPHRENLHNWISNNKNINIGIDSDFRKFKHHKLALKSKISASPIISDGKIFILSEDGYITAFDETSLKKLWSTDIVSKASKSSYMWGGITHHQGKLFVTNGSRKFDIIDASTGQILFSKQFPDLLVTTPVIGDGIVLLQTMSNQIYMLALSNYAVVWDHSGNAETIQGGNAVNPVIAHNNIAILGYTSGQVAAVNLQNRQDVWQMDLSSDNSMPEYTPVNLAAEPIIEDKFTYLADNNGKLFKIHLETGATSWVKNIDDIRTVNETINALIITTNGRQVVAVDKANGKVIWATNLAEKGKTRNKWNPINYVSTLVINDMFRIYTSKGEYYSINLTNGNIEERLNVVSKASFVTVTDKVRIFEDKEVYVSEPYNESKRFSFWNRFDRKLNSKKEQ